MKHELSKLKFISKEKEKRKQSYHWVVRQTERYKSRRVARRSMSQSHYVRAVAYAQYLAFLLFFFGKKLEGLLKIIVVESACPKGHPLEAIRKTNPDGAPKVLFNIPALLSELKTFHLMKIR